VKRILVLAAVALLVTGCTGSPAPEVSMTSPSGESSPSPTADAVAGFAVTSPDFADGDELADWTTASAFGGQCTGDNLNPALEWTGAPEGTAAFAVTMIDRSASNFIHWVHGDIPGEASGVARGESADLPGFIGDTNAPEPGYFGPCPPGPDHRYEFTVYALDAPLGLADGVSFAEFKGAVDEHTLASASISGMRSGSN
jgi:Raf kinase inhibitor-like YbhB/YbcL family protein